jgi:DNA-binding response OmpR family regulator
MLELVGFDCEIILSAKEALNSLSVCAPDLILLDIRLGVEISGEDILYQIRSNQSFDKTSVVITTADPRLALPLMNLAELVLVKPIEMDQFKNLMQRLGSLDFKSKLQIHRDPVTELFSKEFFLTRLELARGRAARERRPLRNTQGTRRGKEFLKNPSIQGCIRYSKKTNEERMASGEEVTHMPEGYPLTGTSFVSEERKEKRMGRQPHLRPLSK